PNGRYGNLSGTSMATPLVAGLVALIKAQNPNLTPAEIRSLIQATGTRVNIETACDCRIDAASAIETVMERKMFVHPQAATIEKGSTLSFTAIFGQPPFTFSSSRPEVAEINEQGILTAKADGETIVTVRDSRGVAASSYKIYVGKVKSPGNPNQPSDPSLPTECPFDNQDMCEAICVIVPNLPWCK
ncbi:MAG: S8 family serine peptidase, partial [Bdellovibrionaceae bacterium]|nr:S8 family serine peptidase [Pseudobdellovibrionaceae bacterium]